MSQAGKTIHGLYGITQDDADTARMLALGGLLFAVAALMLWLLVLRFLEKRFGVGEPNISPWRRAICGDLTSIVLTARALVGTTTIGVDGGGNPLTDPSTRQPLVHSVVPTELSPRDS